ncbi:MAG: hypothetical protein ACTSW1_07745 [Candidatus Hodarchaeales archaeon]
MGKEKIPCKDCLCLPICKHKNYMTATSECSIVYDFLYSKRSVDDIFRRGQKDFWLLLRGVWDEMKPTLWEIGDGKIVDNPPYENDCPVKVILTLKEE